MRQSGVQECLYVSFFSAILYVGGTLPCGRFYYENVDGFFGNAFLRLSYEYLYLYLGIAAHLVDKLERRLLSSPVQLHQGLSPLTPAYAELAEGAEPTLPAQPTEPTDLADQAA